MARAQKVSVALDKDVVIRAKKAAAAGGLGVERRKQRAGEAMAATPGDLESLRAIFPGVRVLPT